MGAALVPKFVRSLALDFPHICLQIFMENFCRQEEKFFRHNTVYFHAGYLPVKVTSKTLITWMIRISALLPIGDPVLILESLSNDNDDDNKNGKKQ